MRKPYILKIEEINTLLSGLVSHGEEETYKRMRDKAFSSIEKRQDMDDIFLDMYEGMIKHARMTNSNSDADEENISHLYILASMMRNVAHQLYRAYNRIGMKRYNYRFLQIVPK